MFQVTYVKTRKSLPYPTLHLAMAKARSTRSAVIIKNERGEVVFRKIDKEFVLYH